MTMQPRELEVRVVLEDGSYWATVEEFPGVFAAGDTIDELRASLEEAISLYLSDPESGSAEHVRLIEFQPRELAATTSAELVYS